MAGCSPRLEHRPAEIVAVPVKDTPPANLLACPEPPPAFPTDQVAILPAPLRTALKTLVLHDRDQRVRFRRLVAWIAPGTCPTEPENHP
ncbi:hypothetical protein DD559_17905 [Sphingomonas pokkalii]|uniref:Uncharacterized protein n=1 Tax=Sphingomonas pokkalii TaxID=2175090 RepID=A0A2U0SI00_9SPHN|nr:hypothetical protein DD559_17905 [Sphingomonas pokkalii]